MYKNIRLILSLLLLVNTSLGQVNDGVFLSKLPYEAYPRIDSVIHHTMESYVMMHNLVNKQIQKSHQASKNELIFRKKMLKQPAAIQKILFKSFGDINQYFIEGKLSLFTAENWFLNHQSTTPISYFNKLVNGARINTFLLKGSDTFYPVTKIIKSESLKYNPIYLKSDSIKGYFTVVEYEFKMPKEFGQEYVIEEEICLLSIFKNSKTNKWEAKIMSTQPQNYQHTLDIAQFNITHKVSFVDQAPFIALDTKGEFFFNPYMNDDFHHIQYNTNLPDSTLLRIEFFSKDGFENLSFVIADSLKSPLPNDQGIAKASFKLDIKQFLKTTIPILDRYEVSNPKKKRGRFVNHSLIGSTAHHGYDFKFGVRILCIANPLINTNVSSPNSTTYQFYQPAFLKDASNRKYLFNNTAEEKVSWDWASQVHSIPDTVYATLTSHNNTLLEWKFYPHYSNSIGNRFYDQKSTVHSTIILKLDKSDSLDKVGLPVKEYIFSQNQFSIEYPSSPIDSIHLRGVNHQFIFRKTANIYCDEEQFLRFTLSNGSGQIFLLDSFLIGSPLDEKIYIPEEPFITNLTDENIKKDSLTWVRKNTEKTFTIALVDQKGNILVRHAPEKGAYINWLEKHSKNISIQNLKSNEYDYHTANYLKLLRIDTLVKTPFKEIINGYQLDSLRSISYKKKLYWQIYHNVKKKLSAKSNRPVNLHLKQPSIKHIYISSGFNENDSLFSLSIKFDRKQPNGKKYKIPTEAYLAIGLFVIDSTGTDFTLYRSIVFDFNSKKKITPDSITIEQPYATKYTSVNNEVPFINKALVKSFGKYYSPSWKLYVDLKYTRFFIKSMMYASAEEAIKNAHNYDSYLGSDQIWIPKSSWSASSFVANSSSQETGYSPLLKFNKKK